MMVYNYFWLLPYIFSSKYRCVNLALIHIQANASNAIKRNCGTLFVFFFENFTIYIIVIFYILNLYIFDRIFDLLSISCYYFIFTLSFTQKTDFFVGSFRSSTAYAMIIYTYDAVKCFLLYKLSFRCERALTIIESFGWRSVSERTNSIDNRQSMVGDQTVCFCVYT